MSVFLFFFCFGHGQRSHNGASTLLQVSEFPGAAFMGYPTLTSAYRAWEDAVSSKTVGPTAIPCRAQLPAPPGSPSTPRKNPPTSPRPSPFSGGYQSPSPQSPALSQREPKPRFVEVIKGSSAGRLRAILLAFDTEPLPYYAVLKGQRPGVYYGMYVSSFFVMEWCHLASAHRKAALEGGGTSTGQVWCMVLTEESANAMFVSTYMRGEVGRV